MYLQERERSQYNLPIFLVISLLLSAFLIATRSSADPLEQTFVARIYYEDSQELTKLSGVDIWETGNPQEKYVLASMGTNTYDALRADGWRVERDQQQTIEWQSGLASRPFNNGYHTAAEIATELLNLSVRYPDLSHLYPYGESHCLINGGCQTLGGELLAGSKLTALRITNENIDASSTISAEAGLQRGQKPVLIVVAAVHAREITTPELALRLATWLLENYGRDATATWLVDWHEIWIIPVANPDGRWLVELGTQAPYSSNPFFQRKNANLDSNGDGTADCLQWPPASSSQYGIDLNRNHSFAWGPPASSNSPCDPVFRGSGPASEPETEQLEALIRTLIADQRPPEIDAPSLQNTSGLLISLHSYGSLVLWPWDYLGTQAPDNAGLQAIAQRLAEQNDYLACQGPSCLYPANGTTTDFAYGELGIPAFTFEVGRSFMPPYEQIDDDQWPRNQPALLLAARLARNPYETIQGPEVTELTAIVRGPALEIEAELRVRGQQAPDIAAASFTIGLPPWARPQVTGSLLAADGAFDSAVEKVKKSVSLGGTPAGRHILFVHGQNEAGQWGIIDAIYFDYSGPEAHFNSYFPLYFVSKT